jgi:hypothetical protein
MGTGCKSITQLQTFLSGAQAQYTKVGGAGSAANAATLQTAAAKFQPFLDFAKNVAADRDAIGGKNAPAVGDCGASAPALTGKGTLFDQLGSGDKAGGIVGDLLAKDQILDGLDAQATAKDDGKFAPVRDAVTKDPTGVVSRINAFVKDVATVKGDFDKAKNSNFMTAPDPLDINGLSAALKKMNATPPTDLLASAGQAAAKIKTSAGTVNNELTNLDALANGALAPAVKPLQDSVGTNIPGLIQKNGALDTAVQSTKPPLTATAPKPDEKLTPGKDMKSDLDAAQTAIDGTKDPITAYNADPKKVQPAQQAIDAADTAVRTAQGDQKAVDAKIRTDVTNAAKPLKVDGATAN